MILEGYANRLRSYSRALNIIICALLLIVLVVCYTLIILIFVSPESLRQQSLLTPDASGISPAAAVNFVAVVLNAATAALVTIAVEQTLWQRLSSSTHLTKLTASETHAQARWTVSPLHRLLYFFNGKEWTLKIAGVALVITGIVSTVLVSGISQKDDISTRTNTSQPTVDMWSGWIDSGNIKYTAHGDLNDVPGITAWLAYLGGFRAPAALVCSTPGCTTNSTANSIRAQCNHTSTPHPEKMFPLSNGTLTETYSSIINPNISVELRHGSPYIYASFVSGEPPSTCEVTSTCFTYEWATIFGAFINNTYSGDGPSFANTVDCLLTLGTVQIYQNETNTPILDRASFQRHTNTSAMDGMLAGGMRQMYPSGDQSPFNFSAAKVVSGTDTLQKSVLQTQLLRAPQANSSAKDVASRIEGMFEMATLMAYVKQPESTIRTITITTRTRVYTYNRHVLATLVVPLLATFLGTFARYRIMGDDVCAGYDPPEIARRGQLPGLEDEEMRPMEIRSEEKC